MNFPAHIFKAYDIRGLVEGELSADLAYRVGVAFAVYLKKHSLFSPGQKVVVGYDMRPSSVPYEAEVVRAITDQGLDVVKIGLSSTPFFNFACAHYPEYAGGIIVTASHNPAQYNGFKMTLSNGLPIGKSTGMSEIRDLAAGELPSPVATKGQVTEQDIFPNYLTLLKSLVNFSAIKPLKIVIDAGNGMAQVTLPKVLRELPITVEYLFLEPDGTFPNHEANPLKTETLRDLQAKVKEIGADFGFALDGDADRIGLVDENGEVVDASLVAALIGREVLKKQPGALGLFDLRSSQVVAKAWHEVGAQTEMCMVGHANIKKMMKDTGAAFASELSLHVYFGELYDLECSDLALLYFLRLVSETGQTIGQLVAPLKQGYVHSGEINFEINDKEGAMQAIRNQFGAQAIKTSNLDGVWYGFDWGFASVRTSNTEPVLRLNLETPTAELTAEKVAEFSAILKKFE